VTLQPYTLSFTVGGLFLFEGIERARLRVAGASWDDVRRTAPAGIFVARGGASSVERIRNEAIRRVSTLTMREIEHLTTASMTDARMQMRIAACRKYQILAEFVHEVLDERLRSFQPEIRVTDFDALLDVKGVHADEIPRLAPSTRARLARDRMPGKGWTGQSGAAVHSRSDEITALVLSHREGMWKTGVSMVT